MSCDQRFLCHDVTLPDRNHEYFDCGEEHAESWRQLLELGATHARLEPEYYCSLPFKEVPYREWLDGLEPIGRRSSCGVIVSGCEVLRGWRTSLGAGDQLRSIRLRDAK